jgi:colanic acid/amylovoran biosynthesis protein
MPKLTVINQPIGNRGDQAAHKALIRLLQQHNDIEITALSLSSHPPETIRQFCGNSGTVNYVALPTFRRRRKVLRRAMYLPSVSWRILERIPVVRQYNAVIRDSDYVLCAPGGICMGGYRNWQHIWELANALALRKRTGIYGRSIGPFDGRCLADVVFRRRSIDILKHVDFVSLRDGFSQQIARELGLAYDPTVDTAFAWKPDCDLPEELRFLKGRQYAVFVPNQVSAWHPNFRALRRESLDNAYRSIIQNILSHGLDVLLLPQLCGHKKTDRSYFMELAEGFGTDRAIVLSDTYDSDIQQRIVAYARFVVGARYHSIVFAINNERPFLCLSYEHKMQHMLELIGLSEYSLTLEDVVSQADGLENATRLLRTVLHEESAATSKIQEANRKAEDIAKKSFGRFVARLYS